MSGCEQFVHTTVTKKRKNSMLSVPLGSNVCVSDAAGEVGGAPTSPVGDRTRSPYTRQANALPTELLRAVDFTSVDARKSF